MHTPAPWMQAPLSPTDVIADDRLMIAMAREGMNGIAREQAAANARLIAAAPDLLAALQSLVAVCENEGFPHLGRILPAARDAIAKATGA